MPVSLTFDTHVSATPAEAWAWMTSFAGISKEMAPFLHMSVPRGVTDLASVSFAPGVPMFRSWVKLFGVLPIDYSRLTLLELRPGEGFVEQSPMGSMTLWRHERSIVPMPAGCRIVDRLTFEPRIARRLVTRIVDAFFTHRHRMLARHLGTPAT